MLNKFITQTILAFCFISLSIAQSNDPILFSVENDAVRVSEFKYIYGKTNGNKADYSKASVEEYLDLYTKFKMQVRRAKDMKLDTISALQRELDTYRKQLADSYLIDKEVTEKLIREAYDRSQKDVNFSHILFKIPKNGNAIDTMLSFQKATDAYKRLEKGETFEEVAKQVSEDDASKEKGGAIGFITAMLPNGFYDFESALYNTPSGKYSKVVRSPMGYHIVKVTQTRPARGEIEVSHILVRKIKTIRPIQLLKQKSIVYTKYCKVAKIFTTWLEAHLKIKRLLRKVVTSAISE